MIKKIKALASRLIYWAGLPVVYLAFKNSTRAYVLAESAGQVLFVKSWFGNQKYKLPGGGLKKGENPKKAAARELFEETGIQADENSLLELVNTTQTHAGASYRHIVYKTHLPKQIWPKKSGIEIMEAVWLNPSQINLHNSSRATIRALKTAGFEPGR